MGWVGACERTLIKEAGGPGVKVPSSPAAEHE